MVWPDSVFERLFRWDAVWYYKIAEKGYDLAPHAFLMKDGANWAFFPLYPLLIRILSNITGISLLVTGYLLSNILFIGVIYGCLQYYNETRGLGRNSVIAILATFGLYNIYFSMFYTESLAAILILGTLYALRRDHWLTAGVLSALLSATRPTGVFIGVFFLFKLWKEFKDNHWSLQSGDLRKLTAIALIPLGLSLFMAHLYITVGDALAFKHIQLAFARCLSNPFRVLVEAFAKHSLEQSYLAVWGIVGLIFGLYAFWQKRWAEGFFYYLCLLPGLASSVQSVPRYLVGGLIFNFILADILNRFPRYRTALLMFFCASNVLINLAWFQYAVVVA